MATKKRPTGNDLKGLLLEGHFGQQETELPMTDPVSTSQMLLKLDEIVEYDRNPRREQNPQYDSIKESIRNQRGLNNPFNITRRPGDEKFMIESGGNTRLRILRELYQETGDETFNQVHCLFVPWKSESHVLTAHLIENELRGDMTLIDKAYAVRELKTQLETEQQSPLSRSEFVKIAKEMGFKISRRHAIRFDYALKLDQMIPIVLRSGLGAHKIDAIKNTENAYRHFCESKTDQFDALFAHIMSDQDRDDWDFDTVRRLLDQRLAEMFNIPEHRLRLQVDAILYQNTRPEPNVDDDYLQEKSPGHDVLSPNNHDAHENPVNTLEIKGPPVENFSDLTASDNQLQKSKSQTQDTDPSDSATKQDLTSLRHLTFALACKLAKSIAMENSVLPVKDGMGFVIDLPPKPIIDQEGKEKEFYIWWLLLSLSDQLMVDNFYICAQTRLHQIWHDENQNLQEMVSQPPDILQTINVFQSENTFSDQNFTDLFRLLETLRVMRHEYTTEQLWQKPLQH